MGKVSNGGNQRDLATYLCCWQPKLHSQQRRYMLSICNKTLYFVTRVVTTAILYLKHLHKVLKNFLFINFNSRPVQIHDSKFKTQFVIPQVTHVDQVGSRDFALLV